MTTTAIKMDHLARVEGHGNVHVVIEDGRVETVEMNIVEPSRLFESMVRGRSYTESSYISSRVCGICSASHVVTDLLAIEHAFGIQVTDRTRALRELLVYGSFLQNHATHLYVLAAPDYLRKRSIFPLAEMDRSLFDQALGLKALGNELCNKVGGRSIHPITAVVGGFTHEITPDEYRALAEKLTAAIPFAEQTVDLFHSFPVPQMETAGDFLAMEAEGDAAYPVEGSCRARFVRAGRSFDVADVDDEIEEYRVDHAAAEFSRMRATGSTFMCSALSRLNASWDRLSKRAKIAAAKVGLRPPAYNPMLNNVAQAIELVDALERCASLCLRLADDEFEGSSAPVAFEVHAGVGVGFTEAPRGSLFHKLELDDDGRIVHASIITPTSENLANLEADTRLLAEQLVAAGACADEAKAEIAKLVRAYDPCLSCSVH
ncbi:MAG: Ni/Fe hydrogenase subunit alpha [Eggerthellaceae bacterium]|jgi:sulfhydrogenase subunit alpha